MNRAYKGLYPEKLAQFLKIYKGNNAGFVVEVKKAFESLSCPRQEITSKEEAMARWKELRGYFKEMWEHERRLGLVRWTTLIKKHVSFRYIEQRQKSTLVRRLT